MQAQGFKMKFGCQAMRKLLCLLCLLTFNVLADSRYTVIEPGVKIYSEYYQNPTAKFPGTIIFENGSGTTLTEWTGNPQFLECIKKLGSVFFYDRNGLGKSPPDFSISAKNLLTAEKISQKLEILLKKRNIKPPYVFAAHSYGAIYAGYFVLKHPTLVKGILLVDPVPRKFDFSPKVLGKYQQSIEEAKIRPSRYIYQKYGGSKTEVIYQLLSLQNAQESLRSLGEVDNAIPIIILSATRQELRHPLIEDWYTSQKQWLNKNPHSKIIRIASGHFIQLVQPQKVCAALLSVLESSYKP
jgi:pimeloyl-ACP methyl ester carboxylesterase